MLRLARKCVKSSWRPFEKYIKDIGDSLGNAQTVLDTFSGTFTKYWIHFGKCPNRSGDPLGAFTSVSPAIGSKVSPHISDMFC